MPLFVTKPGSQSDWRRICSGLLYQRRRALFGQKILHGCTTNSSKHIWRSSERLRVRPRGIQQKEHQASKEYGCKTCRDCSPRPSKLGCIGSIKSPIYGFNKPNARSVRAMGTYGHRAILGFNMRKLIREQLNLQLAAT